jgi:hypothetical protein
MIGFNGNLPREVLPVYLGLSGISAHELGRLIAQLRILRVEIRFGQRVASRHDELIGPRRSFAKVLNTSPL